MRATLRLTVGATVLGAGALLSVAPASAAEPTCPTQSVYSSYAQACVPADSVDDNVVSNNSTSPSSLPFTGGEVALAAAIGVGALVVGTGLVVAGRRRGSAAAA
jgi:hypothetical protein